MNWRLIIVISIIMVLNGGCKRQEGISPQVLQGEGYYNQHCAPCHGTMAAGEVQAIIGVAPSLVGDKFGEWIKKSHNENASSLHHYISQNMPPGRAGTISEEKYWAITAFLLSKNGVKLPDNLNQSDSKKVAIP
jgi:cytochrome c